MTYCVKCGNKLEYGMAFCPLCGAPAVQPPAQQNTAQQPQQPQQTVPPQTTPQHATPQQTVSPQTAQYPPQAAQYPPQQAQHAAQPQYPPQGQYQPAPAYAAQGGYPAAPQAKAKGSKLPIIITVIIILAMAVSAAIAVPVFLSGDPFIGTWSISVDDTKKTNLLSENDIKEWYNYTFVFNADNTYTISLDGEQVDHGTWKKTDNSIIFTTGYDGAAGETQTRQYSLSDGKLTIEFYGYMLVFRK